MKREEFVAREYLVGLAKGAVVFEPDGNRPPDFSLASRIGVEVRRLNKHYFDGETAKGLETERKNLRRTLREVLKSFDKRYGGCTYEVGMAFKRPILGRMKQIKTAMDKVLKAFIEGSRRLPTTLYVKRNLEFDIFARSPVPPHVFIMLPEIDTDGGGPATGIYCSNIRHCLQEKNKKIAPHKPRYGEWWLLLVDTIHDFHRVDLGELRQKIDRYDLGAFNKLILLDYAGDRTIFEVS